MCKKYAEETNLKSEIVEKCLENLRRHSYKKFLAREKYRQEGIGSLNIKISGEINLEKQEEIEIDLEKPAIKLKEIISDRIEKDIFCLKMICNGKLLENDQSLSSQGVKVIILV